ncbi:RNA-guided endonuclease TnpB family protein [Nostoc sp. UHCC 0251]|uniref:RNA-guided endonuclease InsQ/TnpB family protein n=1 Tax=Nostoc sp. UHCC 0251 TaxID=3110240 RepID=UPI002B2184D5|nr:RNA-guided endonuclease TnpB family protein [Nostoc sp. UHCC 0251]MEA5627758.1 RNA-guided endonuclease TnpB family protein [Nostoc sp. UHCC 0251]
MLLSIKTQLKLNSKERVLMSKHAGIARFTYNWGLATWQALYKDGYKPNQRFLRTFFNNHVKINPDLSWLKENGICQKITEFAFENLGDAYKRFFKGLGNYPRFKKRSKSLGSFTVNSGGKPINVGGTRIKLPTIGWVRTYEELPHTSTTKFTISERAGNWYISFTFEQELPKPSIKIPIVGVDLGIKVLATISSGVVFDNPKARDKMKNKLAKQSRQLSKKTRGSKRYLKQKLRVARTHKRTSDIRLDATHKATTTISKNHAKIVVERLNVLGMMSNHKLAGAVGDANFYEFSRQLEYKCKKFGSEVIFADPFYPSSKTCSNCGHIQDMPLSVRIFDCQSCKVSLDRDWNASKNLEKLGL